MSIDQAPASPEPEHGILADDDVVPSVTPEKSTGLHQGEPAPGVAKVDPIMVADHISQVGTVSATLQGRITDLK